MQWGRVAHGWGWGWGWVGRSLQVCRWEVGMEAANGEGVGVGTYCESRQRLRARARHNVGA